MVQYIHPMSNNDMQLINQAWDINPMRWYDIDALIDKAESAEAKEELRSIRNYKYHIEEYKSGLN